MTRTELLAQGLVPGVIDAAQLVLYELVGNSVRACGTTSRSWSRCT
ncbi:hypothetical protein [Streptomyces hyaluromycini]|nr:hypothetical protein [Streptomyces hyaluromycini]